MPKIELTARGAAAVRYKLQNNNKHNILLDSFSASRVSGTRIYLKRKTKMYNPFGRRHKFGSGSYIYARIIILLLC